MFYPLKYMPQNKIIFFNELHNKLPFNQNIYNCRSSTDLKHDLYENILEASPGFRNPNSIDCLFEKVGLSSTKIYTNMSGLNGKFPAEEYGSEIRQVQASKWAFR